MVMSTLFVDSDMEEEEESMNGEGAGSYKGSEEEVKGDEEEATDSVSKKKKRTRKDNKKTKMSKKEAKELKEKEYTLSSNLYRVQIEELLKEISITENQREEGQMWFEEFKTCISRCKPSKPFKIQDVERMIKPVQFPLPKYIKIEDDSTDVLRWVAPLEVKIVGSWGSGAAVDKISSMDIALVIPDEFFRKKDYMNHRYHVKRAAYLAYVAKLLLKRGETVSFALQQGNPIKSMLKLECKSITVQIIAYPANLFKNSRLSPDINNLRYKHLLGKDLPEDEPEVATPHYNYSIATDVLIDANEDEIHHVIQGCACYSNAVKILKIWLHQRDLDKGFGCFNGFVISAFVVYLSSIGKIEKVMTTLDVIRIIFQNLSATDWSVNGIGFCENVHITDWHLQFDVVFLDASGSLNYTADVTKFTFKRIQEEAKQGLEMLEQSKVSSFHSLFLAPVPFIHNFDHVLQLVCRDPHKLAKGGRESVLLNHSLYHYPVVISILGEVIEQCFGDRVKVVDHQLPHEHQWSVIQPPPELSCQVIRFGFIINREEAYKLVEKCDAEDAVKANLFKEFWGTRSQLRRFKDGTMCETVVFEQKRQLLFQMISYIIQTHFDLKPAELDLLYADCQLEDVVEKGFHMVKRLSQPKQVKFIKGKRQKPSHSDLLELVPVDIDSVCNKASRAFDGLAKTLRALEGLPLEVSTVQGTSPILRFTSVNPTPAQYFRACKWLIASPSSKKALTLSGGAMPKVPKVIEPITLILHLETSGKWPEDVNAVERLKCAFLSRISQLLETQCDLTVQLYPQFLDVVKEGFIFRIKLTYYRELTLIRQHLGPDGILKFRDTPESLRLEKESLLLPQLTTTLHSFHCQFEAFGKTCRLAKRWIASQLLLASPLTYNNCNEHPDCRFSEESIELLVAYIFISFPPHLEPPHEGQVGFLRFLSLMSSCDWRATPIILNFHEKLSSEEVSAIELDFVKRRDQLPALFIATPEDKSNSVWSKHLSPVLLYRAKLLANEALNVFKTCLVHQGTLSEGVFERKVKTAFRADTHEFDVIIHLKKEMNPRSCDSIDSSTTPKYHELHKTSSLSKFPILDFDPVQSYLSELRSAFGHLALFLHDSYGGNYIAVVWKPQAFNHQCFSVSTAGARKLFGQSGKVAADVDEVIESFEILGRGLIATIESKMH